jgi:large subunit ribosomal protein L25
MAELKIEVQRREETGKGPSRRLRAGGMIPAVVYGGGKEPVPIQVERNIVLQLLKQGGGENAVFLLKLSGTGKSRHTMVRKIDVDPISRQIAHIDFQRILLTEKVRVQIPLELIGEAWGVKNEGGVLDFITREVEVECLPTDIPQKLEVDVSDLHVGQHLEVKDLVIPPGVQVLDEPDRVMAAVAHSRVAAEVTELEEGLEEEEGLLEAEKEEPEVIGRGKEAEAEETRD